MALAVQNKDDLFSGIWKSVDVVKPSEEPVKVNSLSLDGCLQDNNPNPEIRNANRYVAQILGNMFRDRSSKSIVAARETSLFTLEFNKNNKRCSQDSSAIDVYDKDSKKSERMQIYGFLMAHIFSKGFVNTSDIVAKEVTVMWWNKSKCIKCSKPATDIGLLQPDSESEDCCSHLNQVKSSNRCKCTSIPLCLECSCLYYAEWILQLSISDYPKDHFVRRGCIAQCPLASCKGWYCPKLLRRINDDYMEHEFLPYPQSGAMVRHIAASSLQVCHNFGPNTSGTPNKTEKDGPEVKRFKKRENRAKKSDENLVNFTEMDPIERRKQIRKYYGIS